MRDSFSICPPHPAQLILSPSSCSVVNNKMLLGLAHQAQLLAACCSRQTLGLILHLNPLQNKGKYLGDVQKVQAPGEVQRNAFYMLLNDFFCPPTDWEGVYVHTCVTKEQKNPLQPVL